MARVGRRPGRRRRRWIVLGLVLTVLVLGVDAAVSSRSDGPARQQAELAYLDNVRPLVDRSNQQGADLIDVRSNAVSLGRDGIGRRLDRVSREAAAVLRDARRLDPPVTLRDADDLLVATFAIRAKAAATMRQALIDALGTAPPEPAVRALVDAGKDMVAADRAYELFVGSLPATLAPGGSNPTTTTSTDAGGRPDGSTSTSALPAAASRSAATAPSPSQWAPDGDEWSAPLLASFVAALRSSQVLSPVHDLAVALVLVDPAGVGTEGPSTVLPPAKNLRLQIVVTNTGNEAERRVVVSATITPSAVGPTETARDFVDLTAGQRRTVVLRTLRPPSQVPFTLTVRIDPVEGETSVADNEKALTFLMK